MSVHINDIGGECMDAPDEYHVMRDGVCVYCGYDDEPKLLHEEAEDILTCPSRSTATCKACSIHLCPLRIVESD